MEMIVIITVYLVLILMAENVLTIKLKFSFLQIEISKATVFEN